MTSPTGSSSAPEPTRHENDAPVPAWLDRLNEIVLRTDTSGRIVFVNSAWTRTLEYSLDETLGRSLSDFVHEQDRDVHKVRFASVLDGRRVSLRHEVRVMGRDGSVHWYELAAGSERSSDGSVTGLTGTLTDVTARRRMADELRTLAYEAQEARADAESAAELLRVTADDLARERDQAVASSRATTEFIASMARDLRTPLKGVLGMTEILLHGTLTDEQRQQARVVRDSADSMVHLVEDIVAFSSTPTESRQVEHVDFDLREVVEDVRQLIAQKALLRGVTLVTTVAPSVPDMVQGDVALVRQVIMNVTSNAIRLADDGDIDLVVTRVPRRTDDGRVVVRIEVQVQNTSASLEQLVARPEHISPDDTDGAGLGMVVSMRLVEQMGGRLDAGSEEGEGGWISIELPLARVAVPTGERVARSGFEGAPLSLRVLVAEDNLVNQKVVSRLLERWGVQVVVVGDGMSAVDTTDRSGFDVILMDVRMPRLDGLQASEEIRSREVVGKRVRTPIVAMTANSDSSDRERCREAGMDGFLAKPIQPAELYAELVRSAGQQGMARAA